MTVHPRNGQSCAQREQRGWGERETEREKKKIDRDVRSHFLDVLGASELGEARDVPGQTKHTEYIRSRPRVSIHTAWCLLRQRRGWQVVLHVAIMYKKKLQLVLQYGSVLERFLERVPKPIVHGAVVFHHSLPSLQQQLHFRDHQRLDTLSVLARYLWIAKN